MNKEFLKMQKLAGLITESQMKAMLNENEQPKIGDKVDVFNPKGKYSKESWWGPDEYLHAEVVKINGQKITVKDINDDEYEVDLTDVSTLD
jgi:hypothetical protein